MDTLLEAVLLLDDTLRSHLSAIHIDDDPDRPLTARLSISIMVPYGVVTEAGPYTITVDLTDLEEGVTHSSWTRWPTITRPLTADVSILDQIQQLQNSGLVGDLDVATFEPVDGPTLDHPARRWVIKPTVSPLRQTQRRESMTSNLPHAIAPLWTLPEDQDTAASIHAPALNVFDQWFRQLPADTAFQPPVIARSGQDSIVIIATATGAKYHLPVHGNPRSATWYIARRYHMPDPD